MQAGSVMKRIVIIGVVLAIGLVGGFVVGSSDGPDGASGAPSAVHDHGGEARQQKWYCSMHPQIIRDGPGLCPICAMELIPMPENLATETAPRELSVNTGLANENARLRQENKRMRAAIDQISGTLAILKASER